jgi:pantoate--beta-alanine ligase
MLVVDSLAELRARRRELPGPVGVVPTMGYLHAGHDSLIARARAECASVIATLFVNPAQFGPSEDFTRYPRDFERDRALCEREGADLLYAPPTEQVYPPDFSTAVEVGGLTARWEGEHRPGHFRGVATVVAKLLVATAADRAYFGEKDFQQLRVVERLARDLDLPVEIVPGQTVREPDGLALSSRNAYHPAETRPQAAAIHEALQAARRACLAGQTEAAGLAAAVERALAAADFRVDYVAIVDPATLEPLARVDRPARALVAARLGPVRLIDNLALEPPP